ncbi:MAG: SDR family oxidoreductase [Candidatus Hodarchaeota archaeon]
MTSMDEFQVLITGSTDGIGKQTAIELAKRGAHVIIHARNYAKGSQIVDEIKKQTVNDKIDLVIADFTSLKQVHDMNADIIKRFDKLDVLINNAGVYKRKREVTEDGFETTFQVNHLSYFLITLSLLDLVSNSSSIPGRIINVASMAHAQRIDFDNLQAEKRYDGYNAYSLSKLCNIIFTFELAERLARQQDDMPRVTVNCLHPGVINTKLLRAAFGGGSSVSSGADKLIHLTLDPNVVKITGKFFVNKRVANPARIVYNADIRKKIWDLSEQFTQIALKNR